MIVSRSDNGILVRIPNGEVAEIQGYISTADTAFSHGAVSAELSELQAIKRWVEHLLRLADAATPPASTYDPLADARARLLDRNQAALSDSRIEEANRCPRCNVLLSQAHPEHVESCDGRPMGPGWEFGLHQLDPDLVDALALVRFARWLGIDPASLIGRTDG